MSDKVFISYSHDTPEHHQRVRELADALRRHGVDVELDQYQVRPPGGWPRWCEEQLDPAVSAFVLVICTETYRQRVLGKAAADEGRGVFWEGSIIYNYLYDEKANKRFIPVLLPGAKHEDIPGPIKNDTRYHVAAFELADPGYEHLYRELTGQPAIIKPPLGPRIPLPPKASANFAVLASLPARPVLTPFIPAEISRVVKYAPADISRIVKYAPAQLIGREAETKLLDDSWDQVVRGEPNRTRVLTFVAFGGEGKTSLVAKWAADLAHREWPGCDAVFAWSFYSQGTREQGTASSDLFLKAALTFFGDAALAGTAQGAYEKGRRLAHLVGERRALLLLDGLEPLQYSPTSPTPGELKDQGIAALLKDLATTGKGLCVVTTRYAIPELHAFLGTNLREEKLKRLSKAAGVALLKTRGIKGSSAEFEKLVEDVQGHALTLNLLGSYLRDAHAGDIRRRDQIKLEEADAEEQGGHAFRVMDAYVEALEHGGKTREDNERGRRALALLSLLGLFDRPTSADCLHALWTPPAISGLTEPLIDLSEAQRNLSLTRLQEARLLTINREAASGLFVALDAHPLLREYFAKRLQEQQPTAWGLAQARLYEHLCTTTKEGNEPTLEALQPLYQAVVHGCKAGLQQNAHDEVYLRRIRRGNEFYSIKRLGAFGAELGALLSFFDEPWSKPSTRVDDLDQVFLLGNAAACLRALGRLSEALVPAQSALTYFTRSSQWDQAAIGANLVAEIELTLGALKPTLINGTLVTGAVESARQAVLYADRSENLFYRSSLRTTYADALVHTGNKSRAEDIFREAETLQAHRQPKYKLLYSAAGYRYSDLLLTEVEIAAWRHHLRPDLHVQREERGFPKRCREIKARTITTLKWSTKRFRNSSMLDLALDRFTGGRISLFDNIFRNVSRSSGTIYGPFDDARARLESALGGLREAGMIDYLARGLLTRAWLRSLTGARIGSESARTDLDEAWEIAERGPMKLFLADIHLHRARLFFRETPYPWNQHPDGTLRGPKDDLAAARRLIEQCGYWRRKEELEDAEAVILPLFP